MTTEQKQELQELFDSMISAVRDKYFDELDSLAESYVEKAIAYNPQTNWELWLEYNRELVRNRRAIARVIYAVAGVLHKRGVAIAKWYYSPTDASPANRGKHWTFSPWCLEEIEKQVQSPNGSGEDLLDMLLDLYGVEEELTPSEMISLDIEFWHEWYSAIKRWMPHLFKSPPPEETPQHVDEGFEAFFNEIAAGGGSS